MSSPLDQLIKCLGMIGSDHDGEVLAAARKAYAVMIANDWTFPQLMANGSALSLSEAQVQKIFTAGIQRGESIGYQKAMADAQSLAPAQAKSASIQIADNIEWISAVLDAAAKAEANNHLDEFETDFSNSFRAKLISFGRATFCSQRQFESLKRLEKSLRRRGYL